MSFFSMCSGQRLSLYFQQGGGVMVFQRQQKPWYSSSIFMPSTYIKPASWSTYCVPSPYTLLNGQPVAHLLHRTSLLVNPSAFLLVSSCYWSTCNLLNGQPVAHLLHRTSLINPTAFPPHSTCLLVNLRCTFFI